MPIKRRLNKKPFIFAGALVGIVGLQTGLIFGLKALDDRDERPEPTIQPQVHDTQSPTATALLQYEADRGILATIFEIAHPHVAGENCIVGVSDEGSVMACFAAAGALPAPDPDAPTPIALPLYNLESRAHNHPTRIFEYRPASNSDVSCLITDHTEDLDIECRTVSGADDNPTPPVFSGNRYTP